VELRRDPPANAIYNVGGGIANSMSLAQLTRWCGERFGKNAPAPDLSSRPFDIPWLVMNSARAHADFGWTPQCSLPAILDEIAAHARANPEWLARSKAL
jgi:CDP-paratose 2-epimerase